MRTKRKGIRDRQGQATVEYALMIVVVIAALLTMQQYVTRGFQGKLKEAVDPLGGEHFPGTSGNKPGVESPGAGFSGDFSSAAATRSATFTYEGKRGFAIDTGTITRHEVATAKGTAIVVMPDLNNNETLADVAAFKESLEDTSFMPTAQEPSGLPAEREGSNEDIHVGEAADEGVGAVADSHNATAVTIIETHQDSTGGFTQSPSSTSVPGGV